MSTLALPSELRRRGAFEKFHTENPAVYAELVRRARLAKARGFERMGMRRLWEVLRWDVDMQTVHLPGTPKLNNDHAPFYSRLIQQQESDLAGFFETREREAEVANG